MCHPAQYPTTRRICIHVCNLLAVNHLHVDLLVIGRIYSSSLLPSLHYFLGPFGAKISKFWALGKLIQSKAKWYQVLDQLHSKYGDYVRTGMRVSFR